MLFNILPFQQCIQSQQSSVFGGATKTCFYEQVTFLETEEERTPKAKGVQNKKATQLKKRARERKLFWIFFFFFFFFLSLYKENEKTHNARRAHGGASALCTRCVFLCPGFRCVEKKRKRIC
jgi:hypothetical protein